MPQSTSNPPVESRVNPSSVRNPAKGTSAAGVDGTYHMVAVDAHGSCYATGVEVQLGTSPTSADKLIAFLLDAGGSVLANSALAGVANGTTTTGAVIRLPFVTGYNVVGPARFFIAIQSNSTSTLALSATADYVGGLIAGSTTGTFGATITSLTVPTTFTTAKAPVASLY